jgi:phenylpyruvate tautomerase PptA (4-oxalocrotonate tautomerase family)
MPTYVCYLPRDKFEREQKARIAGAISQRHSEATGAPSYFVQVMIEETDADRYLGVHSRPITFGSVEILGPVGPRISGRV